MHKGGCKVREWAGKPNLKPTAPPRRTLNWDFYCGPSPLKPFVSERLGGVPTATTGTTRAAASPTWASTTSTRSNWIYGKDDTSPVEIEASAPPSHPEVTGMWAWVELKYADGLTIVMDSGEWGAIRPEEGTSRVAERSIEERPGKSEGDA